MNSLDLDYIFQEGVLNKQVDWNVVGSMLIQPTDGVTCERLFKEMAGIENLFFEEKKEIKSEIIEKYPNKKDGYIICLSRNMKYLSFCVFYQGKYILLNILGNTIKNLKKLNIDISDISYIVLSSAIESNIGGLPMLLKTLSNNSSIVIICGNPDLVSRFTKNHKIRVRILESEESSQVKIIPYNMGYIIQVLDYKIFFSDCKSIFDENIHDINFRITREIFHENHSCAQECFVKYGIGNIYSLSEKKYYIDNNYSYLDMNSLDVSHLKSYILFLGTGKPCNTYKKNTSTIIVSHFTILIEPNDGIVQNFEEYFNEEASHMINSIDIIIVREYWEGLLELLIYISESSSKVPVIMAPKDVIRFLSSFSQILKYNVRDSNKRFLEGDIHIIPWIKPNDKEVSGYIITLKKNIKIYYGSNNNVSSVDYAIYDRIVSDRETPSAHSYITNTNDNTTSINGYIIADDGNIIELERKSQKSVTDATHSIYLDGFGTDAAISSDNDIT